MSIPSFAAGAFAGASGESVRDPFDTPIPTPHHGEGALQVSKVFPLRDTACTLLPIGRPMGPLLAKRVHGSWKSGYSGITSFWNLQDTFHAHGTGDTVQPRVALPIASPAAIVETTLETAVFLLTCA